MTEQAPRSTACIRAVVREPAAVELPDQATIERQTRRRFERAPQNGEYAGPLPVRHLPRGFAGEDVREEIERRLVVGSVWIRGLQRVQVLKVTPGRVTFRELSHGRATRSQPRGTFLSQGKPAR